MTGVGRQARRRFAIAATAWVVMICTSTAVVGDEQTGNPVPESVKRAISSGEAVAIMRHASAPGVGDPVGFRVDDCATQRNLSDAGRAEAVRVGAMLRRWTKGSGPMEVYTSAWCRCRDTATLLDVGPVEPLAALDSFFVARDRQEAQTAELERWVLERLATPGLAPAVLVTHQVNLSALTGAYAMSGEMVIVVADENAADKDASAPSLRVIATRTAPGAG